LPEQGLEVDGQILEPHVFEHADARHLVIPALARQISVVAQLDRDAAGQACGLNAGLCLLQLALTQRDAVRNDPVVLCRVHDECAPATPHVEQPFTRAQLQLAANVLELGHLCLFEREVWTLEVSTGVHHPLVQPQTIEVIGDVIVETDRLPVFRLRMGLHTRSKQRCARAVKRLGGTQLKRRQQRSPSLSPWQPEHLDLVLEPKGLEEVAFDVEIAPEVGVSQPEWVTATDQAANNVRRAAHQRERCRAGRRGGTSEHERAAIPQTQRHAAVEGAKEPLQRFWERGLARRQAGFGGKRRR